MCAGRDFLPCRAWDELGPRFRMLTLVGNVMERVDAIRDGSAGGASGRGPGPDVQALVKEPPHHMRFFFVGFQLVLNSREMLNLLSAVPMHAGRVRFRTLAKLCLVQAAN